MPSLANSAARYLAGALLALGCLGASAQTQAALHPVPVPPQESAAPAPTTSGPVLPLYHAVRNVGLDPQRVYKIREAEIDREDVHLWLNDGTIAFTQAVDGTVTGAYFEGDGEVLMRPPDRMERASLGLFINAGVLEESFNSAYLRFNDDTAKDLEPYLRPPEDAADFIARSERQARALAADGRHAAVHFLHQRAADRRGGRAAPDCDRLLPCARGRRTLRRVRRLSSIPAVRNRSWWAMLPRRPADLLRPVDEFSHALVAQDAAVRHALRRPHWPAVDADVLTDQQVHHRRQARHSARPGGGCDPRRRCEARRCAHRALRIVPLPASEAGGGRGQAAGVYPERSVEGSELSRRGNDTIAVVFPQPLQPGAHFALRFSYAGSVLSDAGGGLLYVGARGTWYPNRGIAMANYDLTFRFPQPWSLVATGKRVSLEREGGGFVGHWISEQPIPIAGFNMGEYVRSSGRQRLALW